MRDIISQMLYGHFENTSEVHSWQRHRLQSAKSLDLLSLFEQSQIMYTRKCTVVTLKKQKCSNPGGILPVYFLLRDHPAKPSAAYKSCKKREKYK